MPNSFVTFCCSKQKFLMIIQCSTLVSVSCRKLFKMISFTAIKTFLCEQYVMLYYFQEAIDKHQIQYDRKRYRRVSQYLVQGYALHQFREVTGNTNELSQTSYPLTVSKKVFSIQFPRVFFASMIIRCMAVICFKSVSDTRTKRIWTGTEMFVTAGKFNEVTFVLWSFAVYGFLEFTLTEWLLDYKFMALHRMTNKDSSTGHLRPARFGLSSDGYREFALFRTLGVAFYHSIMITLMIGGTLVPVLAIVKGQLMQANAVVTSFWFLYAVLWILYVCNGIYSNLTSFMIISKYLNIKQQSICHVVEQCLQQLRVSQYIPTRRLSTGNCSSYLKTKVSGITLRNRFLEQQTRYAHFLAELADYNHFWVSFLSFLFINYILLIAVILYVLLASGTPLFFKYIYGCVLFFHIVLLGAIISHCGALVVRNARLCVYFKNILAHFMPRLLDTHQLLKLNHMSQYLTDAQSGFNLLNEYVINYDTFRYITYNITLYFILIIKD